LRNLEVSQCDEIINTIVEENFFDGWVVGIDLAGDEI